MTQIEEIVLALIKEEDTLGSYDHATVDSRFIEDLQMDSLDMVEAILTCEDYFGIVIPDEEMANLPDIKSLSKFIEEELKS